MTNEHCTRTDCYCDGLAPGDSCRNWAEVVAYEEEIANGWSPAQARARVESFHKPRKAPSAAEASAMEVLWRRIEANG